MSSNGMTSAPMHPAPMRPMPPSRPRGRLTSLPSRALDLLSRALPHGRTGDRVYALVHFVRHQRRLPRRRLLFNDYLLRLKLSGELLSLPRQLVSDKELCKLYVDHAIGPGRTVPTLAVLRNKDEVREAAFPPDCVIKATHSTARTIIRRNGAPLDLARIRGFFDDSLYRRNREMNYRFLEPKVIVEPILFDARMIEFKIHCYRGKAKIISVQPSEVEALERFDRHWNRLPIEQRRRPLPKIPTPRPACLDAVLAAADRLSRDFEYIRVDAYVRDPDWAIGELTNCHMNVAVPFKNLEQERIFSRILFED